MNAGKDRTGLIVMLLLLVCDAPQESIVLDFVQSELQLKASREDGDMADFDGVLPPLYKRLIFKD